MSLRLAFDLAAILEGHEVQQNNAMVLILYLTRNPDSLASKWLDSVKTAPLLKIQPVSDAEMS
jgi:hypothetical protein